MNKLKNKKILIIAIAIFVVAAAAVTILLCCNTNPDKAAYNTALKEGYNRVALDYVDDDVINCIYGAIEDGFRVAYKMYGIGDDFVKFIYAISDEECRGYDFTINPILNIDGKIITGEVDVEYNGLDEHQGVVKFKVPENTFDDAMTIALQLVCKETKTIYTGTSIW